MANIISKYERVYGQTRQDKSGFQQMCYSWQLKLDCWYFSGAWGSETWEIFGDSDYYRKTKKCYIFKLEEENLEEVEWMEVEIVVKTEKEILIEAVAQDITTYMMSIFKIPKGLVDKIHVLLYCFWW